MMVRMHSPRRALIVSSVAPPTKRSRFVRNVNDAEAHREHLDNGDGSVGNAGEDPDSEEIEQDQRDAENDDDDDADRDRMGEKAGADERDEWDVHKTPRPLRDDARQRKTN